MKRIYAGIISRTALTTALASSLVGAFFLSIFFTGAPQVVLDNFQEASSIPTALASYQFGPISGQIVTGTATSTNAAAAVSTTVDLNTGSWKGALADDNTHWMVLSTASGIDVQLTVGRVQLNGANTLILETEIDADATAPSILFQICDWVSTTNVDRVADAQCTGGGWRTLNVSKTAVAPTTYTAYHYQIYDGYWPASNNATSSISTPLSNFVNGDRIKIRYFSTTNTTTPLGIDYLRVYAVVNPLYTASGAMSLATTTLTVAGSYASTTIGVGQTGSDNAYMTVTGTATNPADYYYSFKNVETYTGMNTILVRAEQGCSVSGTVSYQLYIRNFTLGAWEQLNNGSVLCSTSDTTSQYAKNNITMSDYISNGEIRVRYLATVASATNGLRQDLIYILVGSTGTATNRTQISFGTASSTGSASGTWNIGDTTNYWNIATEDEAANFGHDYYPYNTDMDTTLEEAAAASIDFPVTVPSDAAVTGIFFAGRFMAGTAGTVQMALRDYGGRTSTQGGWVNIGGTGTTALTYTDNYTVASVATGGLSGYITNPQDFVNTVSSTINLALRTTVSGSAASNSTRSWDFAMVSIQWVKDASHPTQSFRFTPTGGGLVTGTATSTNAQAAVSTTVDLNVGSWKGTLANDNAHWMALSSASGINMYLDVGDVDLHNANTILIETEIDEDATSPALQFQICDWTSSTGVDAPSDSQCTGGGWRTLNANKATIAPTAYTNYVYQIYNGYWSGSTATSTPVSTPLSNFVDSTNKMRFRYFSTTNTTTPLGIDYLFVQAAIHPIYGPSQLWVTTTNGTTTGRVASTTIAVSGQTGSDNAYLTVTGTAQAAADYYLDFHNVRTYAGMNTVLVRAEFSCSTTGISSRPKIYNFNSAAWEYLAGAAVACSATDQIGIWAKNNVSIGNYLSSTSTMRIGWEGSAASATVGLRLDYIYAFLGTTNTDTTAAGYEVSFGTAATSSVSFTRDIDTSSTTIAWQVNTEDESANFGHDYYPFNTDMDTAVEEAAAASITFSGVTVPASSSVTGLFFASRHRGGATAGSVVLGLRDFGSFTTVQGGWVHAQSSTASTAFQYVDNVVVGLFIGGIFGYYTNAEDFVDTVSSTTNLALRTSVDGATTANSVYQWDFAMSSFQWIEYPSSTPPAQQQISISISDNSIGFGTLLSTTSTYATGDGNGTTTPGTAAHTVLVSTNATNGFTLSISGETLESLNNPAWTISAIGASSAAPLEGTEQFGVRYTVSGGSGTVSAPYNSSNYALDTAAFPDVIGSSSGASASSTYSAFYLANVSSTTEASPYTGQAIYTVTGNF